MPQISYFYGIYIFMNFNDHNPAHFHAWYGDYKVSVDIMNGVIKGKMPRKELKFIFEWLDLHKEELLINWEKAKKGDKLNTIEPLNNNIMFLEIIKAEYLEEYKIRLWFNNGMVRDVDLSDSLNGEIFKPLLDKDYFKNFTIHFNTIEWENGADFAPEYLFEKGVAVYDINEKCTGKVAENDIPYNSEK